MKPSEVTSAFPGPWHDLARLQNPRVPILERDVVSLGGCFLVDSRLAWSKDFFGALVNDWPMSDVQWVATHFTHFMRPHVHQKGCRVRTMACDARSPSLNVHCLTHGRPSAQAMGTATAQLQFAPRF